MKFLRVLLVATLALMLVAVVQAQDTPIAYGETVAGEISSRTFEVAYAFEGEAGDIALITLTPDDIYEGFDEPALLLLNADGDVLVSIDAIFANAILVHELEASGTYTIIATRQDGRSGESEGAYTLSLSRLDLLEVNVPVEGSASATTSSTYAVRSSTPVDLRYVYNSGALVPALVVNAINNEFAFDNNLDEVVTVTGSTITRVTVGIPETDTLYVVTVGVGPFYFSFSDEEETVEYTLTLLSAE
jgi:hypothetical protein